MSNLDTFQVIADPSRRQILMLLTKNSYNINSLSDNFEMSRPAVSKHIKILQKAGFISIQEIGRERHCILNQEGFNELKVWINHFDEFWNSKLKNLETVLKNKKN
ncbi:metalloregulator ArsR/SmtB family transcription factor [Reichenbachiella carrageenanivorans]|uniref:Metalloregulator ArsR/SmtB family transcription factor n=1 Tax=Reichenbachiella carrageenanivorans TaxID=2979869 RepID=A0ABY6CXM7_9BACT|nr:metalloregulator ArsR/SmtB family transcription factor [Reichenbachiella carrageenanivorans]UXX78674.1 metalloregulator ArsR/SmtB family transcription factor [Reichenbachiella carrageenanivorans]